MPPWITNGRRAVIYSNLIPVLFYKNSMVLKTYYFIFEYCFFNRILSLFPGFLIDNIKNGFKFYSNSIIVSPASQIFRKFIHKGHIALNISQNHRVSYACQSYLKM